MPQIKVAMMCSVCSELNYITTKNRQAQQKKLTMKKHCHRCNAHTEHKESRLKK